MASAAESLYGINAVRSALMARRRALYVLHVADGGEGKGVGSRRTRLQALTQLAQAEGVPVRRAQRPQLAARIAPDARHQDVLLECGPLPAPRWSLREAQRWLAGAGWQVEDDTQEEEQEQPLDLHQAASGSGSSSDQSTRRTTSSVAPRRRGGGLVLALEDIQDPHNLGAVLRTAVGLGADAVLLTPRCARLSAAVAATSAGALDLAPLFRCDQLSSALQHLRRRGMTILGSGAGGDADELEGKEHEDRTSSGESKSATRARQKTAGILRRGRAPPVWTSLELGAQLAARGPGVTGAVLVMGNEGRGLSVATAAACDAMVAVPMQGNRAILDSLNVSVATSILLHELVRARAQRAAMEEEQD